MNIRECYEAFGGDLDAVKSRISKEEIIQKFVLKFLADPSYDNLCKGYDEENITEAFRAAHSLKGVCFNLGFQKLGESSSAMTELLRGKEKDQIDKQSCDAALKQVKDDYQVLVEAIKQLD